MARLTKGDILARREAIARVARAHGAADIRLFGSLARDEADEASDVDFLVTPAVATPPSSPAASSPPSRTSWVSRCRSRSTRRA